jgi:hypothetical protein
MKFQYHGISKESEGSEKREEDIPIVIRVDGVLEWLQERNLASRNWMAHAAACRKALKVIDYVMALDHMEELLKTTPDQSRGLFGGYNNATLADCEGSISNYTKGNVHWAECASSLAQIVK